MKKIAILLSLLLIAACGKPGVKTQNEAERRKAFNEEFSQFVPKNSVPKNSVPKNNDGQANRTSNILPADNLFKIIEAVPEQTTTWSCGLVSSRVAQASSYLSMGLPIQRQDVAQCNEVGDYPLLINVEIKRANLSLAQRLGLPLEGNYFRVGAAPQNIPSWLDAQLAEGIRAHYLGFDDLNAVQLKEMIDKSIAVEMPLLVLYVVDAARMTLHYVNIVGYGNNGNTLVILDTTGEGIKRMRRVSTEDFINSMDTVLFKQNLLNKIAANKDQIEGYLESGELPNQSVIDGIGRYNLISFTK